MTRSEFLRASIEQCRRNLAKENVRYPNGRMSHEVEAEHLDSLTEQSAKALGQEQNAEGVLRENNPFMIEHERQAWFDGWDRFQPIREEWEATLD